MYIIQSIFNNNVALVKDMMAVNLSLWEKESASIHHLEVKLMKIK